MHALYLLGEPGVGKSTALAHIIAKLLPEGHDRTAPFAHTLYNLGDAGFACYLGKHDGIFPGTDRLSMSVIAPLEPWLKHLTPAFVLAEGDRLANDRYFKHLRAIGYTLSIAHLRAEEAPARRLQRSSKAQNPVWVAGRKSKHLKLAERWDALEVNASGPVETILWQMELLPALRALREATGHERQR